MSSFLVKRYLGDDNDVTEPQTDKLQNILLAKIEERKRRRDKTNIEDIENKIPESDNEVVKTKIKKREIQKTPETEIDDKLNSSKLENGIRENEETVEECDKVLEETDSKQIEQVNVPTENAFTVLNKQQFTKVKKIKRVLPNWLSEPCVVSVDLKDLDTAVDKVKGLEKWMVDKLMKNNITHFFPVQKELIPWLLKYHLKIKRFRPSDACISVPTGSGKTLAYVIPIVQTLKKRFIRKIRALVILPTRDLSQQVYKVFKQYTQDTDLNVVHLNPAIPIDKEKSRLIKSDINGNGRENIADIVITTPGRLIEHLYGTEGLSFRDLQFLVVDEADRVMEYHSNEWLRHLEKHLAPSTPSTGSGSSYCTLEFAKLEPFRPQRLFFSATLSQDPEKLQAFGLFQPRLFTSVIKMENEENTGKYIGKFITPTELSEHYVKCNLSTKPLIVYELIKKYQQKQVMCFVDSKLNAHRLSKLLKYISEKDADNKQRLRVGEISSMVNHEKHKKIIKQFEKGSIDVLITTDALARGIDIPSVNWVILYDVPKFPKNYIHRIGRTARAGQKGSSFVLITPEEENRFQDILLTCGKNDCVTEVEIDVTESKVLIDAYKSALGSLKNEVLAEGVKHKQKMKNMRRGIRTKGYKN